mgnify:CR=1 FL=1
MVSLVYVSLYVYRLVLYVMIACTLCRLFGYSCIVCSFFFFQAEDGIRDLVRSRGLGDVYKRQVLDVASILAQVDRDAVGTGPLAGERNLDRVGVGLSLIHI